uniref:Protein MIS12 homolog n=1 Tax=Leptobrachium leishanense TaxID=445787 RepID=A0A8C5PT98_9ANUR
MSITPMCYEAQFFEFTPQTCILRLYISFQDFLFEMLLIVEKVILKKLETSPGHRISKFHVRQSTEKYLQFLNERFNHLFQKMEKCLLKLVLQVPKTIVLPEDEVHSHYPYSAEQYKELQSQTGNLQEQYKAESLATLRLLAELEEQKAVEAELEKVLAWFDGLDKICREHGNIDLKESFAFMTQSVKRLQGTMTEIHVKSKKLKRLL